jgi:hypothetical protein
MCTAYEPSRTWQNEPGEGGLRGKCGKCGALGDSPNLMNEAKRVLKAELMRPQLRSGWQPSPLGDPEVTLGGGEGQDMEMGRHPLAQVDGADNDGPWGLQALEPSGGNPRFRILKYIDSRRVILMERKSKNDTGAWEYFTDPERAFNTCCLTVTGGEERL